jgi:DNA-binding GntR family transcriptional regulator
MRATTRAQARLTLLARQIADLAARGAWEAGRHVTEMALCQALGVSRTPVRSALRMLQERGALEARPNQGFFLRIDGRLLGNLLVEAGPTAEEALYARIVRDRIQQVLPEEVTRAVLAERYAAGRVTLEHVVARLADDGLLLRGGGRGLRFVNSLNDAGNLRASYELRAALEPAAILVPGFHADPAALAALRSRHQDFLAVLDGPEPPLPAGLVTLDADFHHGLAGFSGNPFMISAVRQQTALRRLLEFAANEDLPRVRVWLGEHLAVLDALARQDFRAASAALAAHLRRAAASSLSAISGHTAEAGRAG